MPGGMGGCTHEKTRARKARQSPLCREGRRLNAKLKFPRRDVLITLTLLCALGVSAALLRWQIEAQGSHSRPLTNIEKVVKAGLYAAEPGQGVEGEELVSKDAYWQARYTYPTGRADRLW